MVRLSIIIPIYNGEKYVENCVNSIINSNIADYEILLINDGSIDNTADIINKLHNNKTVKAFNISHRGLSETRNFGLNNCLGSYVSFIDVDDEVNTDFYKVNNYDNDLLIFGYQLNFIDEKYEIDFSGIEEVYEDPKNALAVLFALDLFNFAWNKVYKKEMIKDLYFSDEYYQGEDLAFNVEVFKRINNLRIIKDILYVYKKRNVETMASKYVRDYDIVLNNKHKLLKEIFKDDDQTLNDYMLKEYEVFVINMFKSKDLTFKQRSKLIKDNILNNLPTIKKAKPQGLYSKMFKMVCLSNRAGFINIKYMFLVKLKNILGKYYLKMRKIIYLKDSKKTG